MANGVKVDIEKVLRHFDQLEDPRSPVNRRHPLTSIVVIAIMAIIGGANGPTAIAEWGRIKHEFLKAWLPLPHGIPSKDVFRRVLMALKPQAFQACFLGWVEAMRAEASEATGVGRPTLAVDGKTDRRSHDRSRNLGALHVVSVWASEYGLTLAQVATDEKSNEITAIPQVLELVDVKGAIVTIDAIGTQTAIAEQIVDGGGDYILTLKGNQGTLYEAAVEYIDAQLQHDFQGIGACRLEIREQGHGREESRTYVQMPVPKDLAGAGRWAGLRTLGFVILHSIRDGKKIMDGRYFLSSLPVDITVFSRAVRNHWRIENSCHWCLDVTYRQDESRIRHVNLRETIAWLNRFTLSLLNQHRNKQSIAMKRRSCGWDESYVLQILTGTAS